MSKCIIFHNFLLVLCLPKAHFSSALFVHLVDNDTRIISNRQILCEIAMYLICYLDFSKKKSWAIVVTPASVSGSVKFFVRFHFSNTIKGIHLKLGILVHHQKRNQLQQGRWPCDLYIQSYLPLFRHST